MWHIFTKETDLTGNVLALEGNIKRIEIFEEISTTSGTVSIPTGGSIVLDAWAEAVDALVLVLGVSGQQPEQRIPRDNARARVTVTSFDSDGNFVLSGTPYDGVNSIAYTQWAIVYVIDIAQENLFLFNRDILIRS